MHLNAMWQRIKWFFRGRPVKKIKGGWCGLCGAWVETAEFTFPDYWKVDTFFDLNTICPNGEHKFKPGSSKRCPKKREGCPEKLKEALSAK